MSRRMTLRTAPPGLLLTEAGRLLFKSEYGDNDGRLDVFIVSSGEYYWGACQNRLKALDEPCRHVSDVCEAAALAEGGAA